MLAICLHMMQGTPYVYQGEELGMTNAPFEKLEDFRDIESINAYHQYVENGRFDHDTMMRYLRYKSRDNARTPMQWDDTENAGFTKGIPWIMVNPNYREINAADQMARPDSVFHFYQKLIRLRKEHEIVVYGHYELLMPDDPELYVYTREWNGEMLLVVCNFSDNERRFVFPEGLDAKKAELWIGNYPEAQAADDMVLRAYEAMVFYFGTQMRNRAEGTIYG